MAERKSYERKLKNLLLNPQFQIKLLSYFIGLFLLTTLSLYSTTFLFFWRLKEKALSVGIPDGHVFYRFIDGQKMDLDVIFLLLTIFNLLLLVGTGFVVSHRIAGTFYKIKTYLKEINSESDEFRLREKDFFKDIEPVINELKDKIK
jgi:sensor histidine kinase YesM